MSNLLIYSIPGFLTLLVLELLWTRRRLREGAQGLRGYAKRDTWASLAMGIGNVIIARILTYNNCKASGDPYYPIQRPENHELYRKYQMLAASSPNVHFVGRLATYRYYNMDQVTAQALTLYARLTGQSRREALASPA